MKTVTVRLTDTEASLMHDIAIFKGYPSHSAVLRAGILALMRELDMKLKPEGVKALKSIRRKRRRVL